MWHGSFSGSKTLALADKEPMGPFFQISERERESNFGIVGNDHMKWAYLLCIKCTYKVRHTKLEVLRNVRYLIYVEMFYCISSWISPQEEASDCDSGCVVLKLPCPMKRIHSLRTRLGKNSNNRLF